MERRWARCALPTLRLLMKPQAPITRSLPREPASLFDRVAVAFGSAFVALILGSFIWFALLQMLPVDASIKLLSFRYVWYFTAAMAALGFILAENLIVEIFGFLMKVVFSAISKN